jgi:hypothetical protein
MKFDGNYRTEEWEKTVDGRRLLSGFVVDDEQVTLTYELWAEILTDLGFTKVDA